MKRNFFYITLIVLAIFVFVSEGVAFNVFTVWNMLPLIISFVLYVNATTKGSTPYGAYGFLIGSMLLSSLIHLAWFFDWGETKTGSSTSALIFIFIPIYSLIPGGIGYAIGKGVARGNKT